MARTDLKTIAQKLRNLDICTFTTVSDDGTLAGRPMSNNGDVAYDGTSWYFTDDSTTLVAEVKANPQVQLAFEGEGGVYVSVSGRAALVHDKAVFAQHWVPDLERWFDDGVDTPGLVLVQVTASRVRYWEGEEQGEWRP